MSPPSLPGMPTARIPACHDPEGLEGRPPGISRPCLGPAAVSLRADCTRGA